jgi:hypothetical protein
LFWLGILLTNVPRGAWRKAWLTNLQFVGSGENAFRYLARYMQSTAIRNSRIVAVTPTHVTYRWTERRSSQPQQATVGGTVRCSA